MLDAGGVVPLPPGPGGTYVVELTVGGFGGEVVLPEGAGVGGVGVPEYFENIICN